VSEPSSSSRLRAATAAQRTSNDRLAQSLGLDPAEERVQAAERAALRLLRRLPRAPDARLLLAQLTEVAHTLIDADAELAKSKRPR
jgi:hypothetical protein